MAAYADSAEALEAFARCLVLFPGAYGALFVTVGFYGVLLTIFGVLTADIDGVYNAFFLFVTGQSWNYLDSRRFLPQPLLRTGLARST